MTEGTYAITVRAVVWFRNTGILRRCRGGRLDRERGREAACVVGDGGGRRDAVPAASGNMIDLVDRRLAFFSRKDEALSPRPDTRARPVPDV
jgi:hypothetical protein